MNEFNYRLEIENILQLLEVVCVRSVEFPRLGYDSVLVEGYTYKHGWYNVLCKDVYKYCFNYSVSFC